MSELGDRREQLRLDLLGAGEPIEEGRALGIDEGLRRLEPGVERGGDEVLALAGEQPESLACAPRLELANELETRVGS